MHGLVNLVGVLLGVGVLLWLAGLAGLGWLLRTPPRMTDGKAVYLLKRLSPGDLQLPFQAIQFAVRDGRTGRRLKLAGWWMPHPQSQGRCIVMVHGYADAKVGVIGWAPLLHELKYNLLALDMRAHGESEGDSCTGGSAEAEDLDQVIDQLRADRPNETKEVSLFGVSMGGVIAALVASRRQDIAAAVLESPFVDPQRAALVHAWLHGLPGRMLLAPATWLAEWMSGAEYRQLRPMEAIIAARCPLLVIHGSEDPFLPPEDVVLLQQAMRLRVESGKVGRLWTVAGAGHVLAMQHDPEEYMREVAEFLECLKPMEPVNQ